MFITTLIMVLPFLQLGGIRSLKTVAGSQPSSNFRQLFRYISQASQRRWDGHSTDDVIHPLNKDESVPAAKYLLYTVAGAAVSYVLYGPHYSFHCSLKVAGAADCFVLERKEALRRKAQAVCRRLEEMMHILDEQRQELLGKRHQIEELIQLVELMQLVEGQRHEVGKLTSMETMHILDEQKQELLGLKHQIEELIKVVEGHRREAEKLIQLYEGFCEKLKS